MDLSISGLLQQPREAPIETSTEPLHRIDEVFDSIEQRLDRIERRLAQTAREWYEWRYERRAGSYFGLLLKRVCIVSIVDVEDQLEVALTDEEIVDLYSLDLLIRGRRKHDPDQQEIWLAVEISASLDLGDIDRARRRTAYLRRAGFLVVPVIAGKPADPLLVSGVLQHRVAFINDRHVVGWEEAVAALDDDSPAARTDRRRAFAEADTTPTRAFGSGTSPCDVCCPSSPRSGLLLTRRRLPADAGNGADRLLVHQTSGAHRSKAAETAALHDAARARPHADHLLPATSSLAFACDPGS